MNVITFECNEGVVAAERATRIVTAVWLLYTRGNTNFYITHFIEQATSNIQKLGFWETNFKEVNVVNLDVKI